jgi:hypothetical protein
MNNMNRRTFLAASAATAALPSLLCAEEPANSKLGGKADSCLFLWLGGGACHIDTFDPKVMGDAKAKKAGSYYKAIDTAVPGIQVCEHLPQVAKLMERCVLLRTVNHDVIDEHGAATNRVHTGRPPTGTITYPSIGSVVSHEIGDHSSPLPPYVVMGYPSVSRGPGFLGAKYGYLYLTDTDKGPAGVQRPLDVDAARQQRREELLQTFGNAGRERLGNDPRVAQYAATTESAFRLMGKEFTQVFDLKSESDALRQKYGGEFGQRCLLARRLVEAGTKFVEVSFNLNFINGTGWDTHNEGQLNQHLLIQQLDQAVGALIEDLEARKRLDRTLIVIATEFGRPPEFDGGGGRGHHGKAFSIFLAGGGLKTGQAIGVTDELGRLPIERPISVPDLHATIYAALGIDHEQELYDSERPVPITDHGKPVAEILT